ncbi:MAG: hypothetical protein R2788_10055 [Saprospiraceae bacterium]|jgi:hypothetical protein
MENQPPEKKKNVFLISGLVFIVLFVLPLGSIYFLNSGANYRKASLDELQEYGKVGEFNLKNQLNIEITPTLLKGRVAVANFLSDDNETAKKQIDRISKVHESYNETEDVIFLSFVKTDSTENLIDLATNMGIRDNKQWFLLGTNKQEYDELARSAFKIKNPNDGIALVDTSMTIRRYYDINSNPEMGRLVEQIAIVIPKQPRRGM